ncbi:MAG TPA: hypothetical protein VGL94_19155 [Ktedonobacteraceae bacterium]|jgi:hypothetical protein
MPDNTRKEGTYPQNDGSHNRETRSGSAREEGNRMVSARIYEAQAFKEKHGKSQSEQYKELLALLQVGEQRDPSGFSLQERVKASQYGVNLGESQRANQEVSVYMQQNSPEGSASSMLDATAADLQQRIEAKQWFADNLSSTLVLDIKEALRASHKGLDNSARQYITRLCNEILIKRGHYRASTTDGTRIINNHIAILGDKSIPDLAIDLQESLAFIESFKPSLLKGVRDQVSELYDNAGLNYDVSFMNQFVNWEGDS